MKDNKIETSDFEGYLLHKLEPATVEIEEITKFERGFSRETWFVKTKINGTTKDYTFRRDIPGGSIQPFPLRLEYDIYDRLSNTTIPVAKTLWYEENPTEFIPGPDFFVREKVEGSWIVPNFDNPAVDYAAVRISACLEHMRILALIHTADWKSLGFAEIFSVPPNAASCATHTVERLVGELRNFQVEPLPVVTEALEWLRENAPEDSPCISLLKGTNGIGEEIWQNNEIVALSDWEESSLGDPASDFAHTQELLPPPTGWRNGTNTFHLKDALSFYESISGIPITEERLNFYRVVRSLESVLFSHHASLPLIAKEKPLARFAWVATEVMHGGEMGLARASGILD